MDACHLIYITKYQVSTELLYCIYICYHSDKDANNLESINHTVEELKSPPVTGQSSCDLDRPVENIYPHLKYPIVKFINSFVNCNTTFLQLRENKTAL